MAAHGSLESGRRRRTAAAPSAFSILTLLTPFLAKFLLVVTAAHEQDGQHFTLHHSRRILHDLNGDSSSGSDGGCSFSFQGNPISFAHCLTLDASGLFTLAWNTTANPGTPSAPFTVFFQGTPQAPYGWAGWGISPSGFMAGSDAIVGYAAGTPSPAPAAAVYHMQGTTPVRGTSSGLLSAVPASLAVAFIEAGSMVQVLANVSDIPQGLVNIIWRGGPGADISTGQLQPHRSLDFNSVAVDFRLDRSEALSKGAPAGTRSTVRIAHAWLAAIGYGVVLPLGILVARHVKLWADPLWLYAHVGLQASGYTLGASAFALGMWLLSQMGAPGISAAPGYQQAHLGIGIAIFCSSTLQILTPILTPDKNAPGRLYWNLVHWGLGYSSVILAFVNIFLGFQVLAQSYDSWPWKAVYFAFLCSWGGLMLVLEPISWYAYFGRERQNPRVDLDLTGPQSDPGKLSMHR